VLKKNAEETLIIQYDWEAYETLKNNMRNATQFDGLQFYTRHFYWRTS
jgi:hypothetical protein